MKRKLKVSDPKFFHKIGKLGGEARKASGTDYSALAASSHPRAEYCGGRPKGSKNKKAKKKENE
jgi:hypothetical protein